MSLSFRRAVSTLCSLALAFSLIPATAFAEEPSAEEAAFEGSSLEDVADVPAVFDPSAIEVTSLETSAAVQEAIALFSLDTSQVPLVSSTQERWIDRVALPDYARQFYDTLVEACDNDGSRDYLIEDRYFDSTASDDGTYTRFPEGAALLAATLTRPTQQQLAAAQAAIVTARAAFDRDHPEVFWLTGSVGTTAIGAGSQVRLYYVLLTNEKNGGMDPRTAAYASEYAIKHGIWSRDSSVRSILQGVGSSTTQYQAVKYFNQWLTQNNGYNTLGGANGNDPYECISALEGRAGAQGPVCEGYARAFKVLCDQSGIPCVLEDGDAVSPGSTVGGPHMWNNVKLAGAWYGVDVTWNDPGAGTVKRSGDESETWLLRGKNAAVVGSYTFGWTHPVANMVYAGCVAFTNSPALSATDYVEASSPSSPVSIKLPAAAPEPQKPRLSSLTLSKKSFTANGKVQRPTVTVKVNGRTLAASSYTVKYSSGCKKTGTYKVTVTGKGGYTGTLTATFKIAKPKVSKTTSLKVKAGKKRLVATWKKAAGKVSGYQIQYSTSKKFTKKKTKTTTVKLTTKLAKKKTLSKTVKKLKTKKTYYVRIRTYYKIGGETFYSSWSKAREVRVR